MDSTPDWDALSDTPPIAPVAQDRSTPMDSQVADFADEANRRVAAGEDAGTVEQDLQRKVTAAEPKTKAKASTDWDSLFDAPPRASELTSAYQPLESYQGQVYNSPSAALAQPDAYAAGSQVQGVGDYLENLGTYAAEKLRTTGAGIVQAVGEIPQMGRDIAAKFDTLTGGVQGGVPPSAVFTAAAQAQGAPADNTLAQAGAFEAQKGLKAQEQAATHLVPAPDENTSGLDQTAYYAQQALVGAPTLAGAMAAGPVGGAALFGATTAGEQYAQKRAAGEAPLSAAASSGIEGAVSALTASLSLDSALNPGALGALRRIAETTGSVEAQSVINEATSIAAEQTIDGKDISADEIKQRLIDAAKGGLPAGVLMGGIGAVAAHDPAAAAAANVERLAANLAPEAVRPTLEERVNAREIPQDQGGVHGQGIVPEGGGENRGPNVQQTAETGTEAGDAGRAVNVDQNVQPAGAERAAEEAPQAQEGQAQEVAPLYSRQEFSKLFDDYDYGRNGIKTVDDVANELEGMEDLPDDVEHALRTYRQEQADDFNEYGGRGDVEPYEDALLAAIKKHGEANERPAAPDVDAGLGADQNRTADADTALAGRAEEVPEPALMAKGETPQSDNLTHDEARDALVKEFGATAVRKLEANGLNLVPRESIIPHTQELTEGQRATVKGFTPADRSSANVVHDNVTRAELPNTAAIHEVVHANLDRILPEATRNALASAIQARGRTSPEVRAALDRIPKTTPKAVYREEVLGQVMGDLYNQPIGRRVMDAFKLGLNRVGVPLDWIGAHEAAIRQIGIDNLRHYAEAPRRAPAMTVQLAAPAVAGQPSAEKPRIRVPVDQVPVQRTGGANDEQRGEAGGRGIPASDAGANASAVREAGGQALPTEAGARNAAAPGVREPPVRTAGEGGVVREPTSIKNETVGAERAARDLGPIETHLGNDFGENNDQAKARLEANPSHGEELAAELAANPRPHTDVESAVLLRDRVRLQNEHADAMKRAEDAMDAGDEQEHLRARATAAQIEARLQLNEEAAKHSGSATARGLNARRAMMNEDYSLARIITRARVLNGGDIAPEQRAIFEDLARRIAANDAVGPEAPAKTARKARTPVEKKSLDDEFSSLASELKKLTQPKASEALFARVEDPKVAAVLRKMAKNRSDAGETDPLKIVDALHDAVGENIPKEDIADTISGYGTTRKPTQDELTTRYNAIKRELADLSRTQDTLSGKIDPNAAKDRARQTALRTEIEGLDRRINYRDAVAPERTKPEYSAATQALKAKRDELAQEVRNLEPSPPTTRPLDQNEVKNKAQRSALQREIDDLDRRIAAKQTEATPRRPFTADAETKNLRALRDAKKRELENLKPSPAATKPEDPRVKRNDIRQKQLQREIADIKSRLQRKDYSRPERQKPVYDAKTTELAAQRAELARRVESELEKIRQQSKSKVERIVDLGLNIRRAVILSSVKTLGKLTGAATERIGFDPIEELAGGFLGHVPGLRGIAAGAPIEGRFSGHAVAEGLRHTFNAESRQAAMQKLKTGLDNLDLTFGNKRDYERSHTWLDYVGQLHGALKTPAKYNRFYSSLAKYAQWERARVIGEGMTPAQADAHMQDPVTIAMMGGKAYENANRSIFMQDNAAVTAYKVMLGYLSKAGAEGSMTRAFSKTAEKVGRYLVPIVRIPTNFVAESGSYGLGAAKALGQVIAAKGVENLTPDQKDYVMRNLKKQTVGAALMYLGYMGAGSIGGYYQQGDNKKTLKNAPGDITIGGVTVPRFLIHNPAMEMVQIGATIRRVAEARARKDEYPMASGALEAGKGLLSEVPFFDAPQRIGNAVTNIKTLGKYLGGEVRSSFIPPDVQNAARMLDNDKKRSPQNFTQELEMGVPGLRPNVPQTKTR